MGLRGFLVPGSGAPGPFPTESWLSQVGLRCHLSFGISLPALTFPEASPGGGGLVAAQYTGGVRAGVGVSLGCTEAASPRGWGQRDGADPLPSGVTSSVPPMPNSHGFQLSCLTCAQYSVVPREHAQPETAPVCPTPPSLRIACGPFLAPWHFVTYNKTMVLRVDE